MRWPRGLTVVMVEGVVFSAFGAVLGLLCARHWGPQLAGVTALSFSMSALCAMVAQLGTDQIVITRFVGERDPARLARVVLLLRVVSTLLALGALAVGTAAMAEALGPWWLLPLLAFAQSAVGVLDVWRLRAQALNHLHRQSPWRLLVASVLFAAKLWALTQQPAQVSVWWVTGLSGVEALVMLTISVAVSRGTDPWPSTDRPTPQAWRAELRELVRAALPLFAAGFAVTAFLRLDYFMLARLADDYELGLYASSMRVLELYMAVGNLALMQFLPQLVQSHRASESAYADQLRSMFGLAYLIALAIVGFNALAGEALIVWVLGPAYAPVATASTLICLLGVPLLSGTVRGFAISIEGLHAYHLLCALLGLALGVPLLALLLPAYGFRGALWADGFTYVATAMLTSEAFPALRSIARAQWRPRLPRLHREAQP